MTALMLPGLHRFYLGDHVLGVVHFLTLGFIWTGTCNDIYAINKLVNDANQRIARKALAEVRGAASVESVEEV